MISVSQIEPWNSQVVNIINISLRGFDVVTRLEVPFQNILLTQSLKGRQIQKLQNDNNLFTHQLRERMAHILHGTPTFFTFARQ